jgi:hypothetical protein
MAFLSQIRDRQESIAPISPVDLDYLVANGYVLKTLKEDHDNDVVAVARLSSMTLELNSEKTAEERDNAALNHDESKEHSFLFHFEKKDEKEALLQRIQNEAATVSKEQLELNTLEADVNELILKKSKIDQMIPYDEQYLSLTDLGRVILSDLNVRNYRVADQEFTDFVTEFKSTYTVFRSIADKARSYVILLKPRLPDLGDAEYSDSNGETSTTVAVRAPSLLWGTAIGLAKLEGDPRQIGERFIQAFGALGNMDSSTPNILMAAEIITAIRSQDVPNLESILKSMDKQLIKDGVPKELSAGVAATIVAGRRFDGSFPTDRFDQFRRLTMSYEAASILAVMNVSYDGLSSKFQAFRSIFTSWGYMASEDTEISSAFLAIGELNADEVQEKLKYIVEQLKNYLEYPLVAAAILASIPVFESHEVLDLMEKAVTLLSGYTLRLERSELVALAVRMIHGVRNELVREIDSTAKITETPVQFTYSPHPNFLIWYYPLIVAHSSYHATFSGMGGFHPAHSHGVGGFAG